ncbi:TPA: hypothetical protein N2F43_004180 [Salmonella enterica]|nr:hypothetical protein [Salmonella enterica]
MIRKLLFIICMFIGTSAFAEDNILMANITPQQFMKIYNKDIGTLGKAYKTAKIKSTKNQMTGP